MGSHNIITKGDERFDTKEDAIGYKKEWLEEHPCINEDQFKVEESR